MSENYLQLDQLYNIRAEVTTSQGSSSGGVWDELLGLIDDLVRKILSTQIGANGKTINDLINDVKNSISGVITSVTKTVNGVSQSVYQYIQQAITNINNTVSDSVSGAVGRINDLFSFVGTKVDNVITEINDSISGIVGQVKAAVNSAIEGLADQISGVINALKNIGNDIGQWISDALGNISLYITNAINDAIDTAAAFVITAIDNIKTWIGNVYTSIKETITGVYNAVSEWVLGAIQTVQTAISNTIEALKDTYHSVEKTIQDWIKSALDWGKSVEQSISQWFWNTVTYVSRWWLETVMPKFDTMVDNAKTIVDIVSNVWKFIDSGNYQAAFDLLDGMFKGAGIPAPINALQGLMSVIAYFWQTIQLQFVPMQVAAQKRAVINLALEPIDLGSAANGVFRGQWGMDDYFANSTLAGISKDKARVAFETNRPLMTPGQAQQAFLRGNISEDEHDHILSSYGLSDETIKEIKALYYIIPPVNDIITMAVREAFSPDIANRFGQYEGLPDAFVQWASKQGLSKEWASRYWAMHWDLPSPQMGFAMFQRGIVDKDDLMLLLKALDIMPFWREKLINLSYNPPTRVDIRRMYKMGMLTEEQVYKFHLDIGYSPDNARMLTDFTKRYSAPEDESQADQFLELARSTYSSAYKDHIISEDEYREFLLTMKYNPEDVELLILLDNYAIEQKDKVFDPMSYRKDYIKLVTNAYTRGLFNGQEMKDNLIELGFTEEQANLEIGIMDYNRSLSLQDSIVQSLHDQYVTFIIDNVELHTIMDTFGFWPEEIEKFIEEWNIERSFRSKRPGIADLKAFFKAGLISLDQMMDELRGMGYHEKYIDLFRVQFGKLQEA